jgi:hypothetical protein
MNWIVSLLKSLTCKHNWLRNEHLPHMARECGKCGKTEFDGG